MCIYILLTAVLRKVASQRGKAYTTMSKVIMGDGGFYGCLIVSQGVLAWCKETAQTRFQCFS